MEPIETVVQCNGKADYMEGIKKGLMEFTAATVQEPEIYGAICLVELGESTQVYQLGNRATLDQLHRHMMNQVSKSQRGVRLNAYGIAIAIFGLGILAGMFIH